MTDASHTVSIDPAECAIIIETAKGLVGVVLTDGQNVTLHAPFSAPPGSPLIGVLRGTSQVMRIKVHGCRRIACAVEVGEGGPSAPPSAPTRFEITGRWVNLSREARLTLLG